jgi:hypothetical protein
MKYQNPRPKSKTKPSNAIRMVNVLFMMPFRAAWNGWRISFVRKGRRVGSWFNPDTITENSFVYGRREKKPRGRVKEIYFFTN